VCLPLVDPTVNAEKLMVRQCVLAKLDIREVHQTADQNALSAMNALKIGLVTIRSVLILAQELADRMQSALH
jgi:hypothetical protein